MRPEKQLLLNEIKEQIEHFETFIIMKYLGLNAEFITQMRDRVSEIGGDVECVKKRILIKACEACNIKLKIDDLSGHIGLVFSGKDAIQTAKTMYAIKKDSGNGIEILGGYIDGKLLGAQTVEKLSTLPGRDEMRAQLLSVLVAPLTETLGTMDALLCSVLYCLDEKVKEKKITIN